MRQQNVVFVLITLEKVMSKYKTAYIYSKLWETIAASKNSEQLVVKTYKKDALKC